MTVSTSKAIGKKPRCGAEFIITNVPKPGKQSSAGPGCVSRVQRHAQQWSGLEHKRLVVRNALLTWGYRCLAVSVAESDRTMLLCGRLFRKAGAVKRLLLSQHPGDNLYEGRD